VNCRLCDSDKTSFVGTDGLRRFVQCPACHLVFVPVEDMVSAEDEKNRYALHDNSDANPKYVEYLNSFADELQRIPLQSPRVLDFGSGPATALAKVLADRGIACESFDPLYGIGETALTQTYEIIALCEVIEHLRDLRKEINLLKTLLAPGGYVLARTELYNELTDFESWWYAKDATHVNFFRLTTMVRIAEYLGKGIFFTNARNLVIFG
jgi:hypothetical protein